MRVKHWFAAGLRISVRRCPTRFGEIAWMTQSTGGDSWTVIIELQNDFGGDLAIHIHRPDGKPLSNSTLGKAETDNVLITRAMLAGKRKIEFTAH